MLQRVCSLLRMVPPVIDNRGLLWGSGSVVPTDGTDGWQTGALYQKTDGGDGTALFVNEGSVTSCAFVPLTSETVSGDLAVVGDVVIAKTGVLRIGDWVGGGATTGGVALTDDRDTYEDGQIDILQVHGVSTTSVGSGHSAKCGRFRHLVNLTGTIETETYGLIGQLVVKTATLGHHHGGLIGTVESSGGFHVGNTLACTAAVIGRPGGSSITVDSGCTLAALAALSNTTSMTITGKYVGLYVAASSPGVNTDFTYGIFVKGPDVTIGASIGQFGSGGATTSGVLFSSGMDVYGDGQYSVFEVHGACGTDLGSGVCAKCGRLRHIVNGFQVSQETYGVMGQMVAKSATLNNMHAGVIGTLEAQTALTFNTGHKYSIGAVIGRIGLGTDITTATTPVCGVIAVNISTGALVSGDLFAFGACSTSANNWTAALAVADCDALVYFDAADSGYENAIKAVTEAPTGNTSHSIKVSIAGVAGYIPVYASDGFGN